MYCSGFLIVLSIHLFSSERQGPRRKPSKARASLGNGGRADVTSPLSRISERASQLIAGPAGRGIHDQV
jgi:hypothetical protein